LCIAETHLAADSKLDISGYTCFSNNRTSSTLKRGSGGISVVINNQVLHEYSASMLNCDKEGILWVELTCKLTKEKFRICGCYLPPEGSSRKVDAQDFYDTLLSQVYLYQNDCRFVICGDFNGRVGDLSDYIKGLDEINARQVIDNKVNRYGELLIDFLVSSNCCIVNGRNGKNGFTSLSIKGKAVVDYCITSYENLHMISDFAITNAKDVYEEAGCIGEYDPLTCCIPDHSLLSWKISGYGPKLFTISTEPQWQHKLTIYDRNVQADFGEINNSRLVDLAAKLEERVLTETRVDFIYEQFVNIINDEIEKKGMKREVYKDEFSGSRKKRRNKPWWSDEHDRLWKEVRKCENEWNNARNGDKAFYKSRLREAQKCFDRVIQRSKRAFWKSQQKELENIALYDKSQFWKSIGKVGIANDRQKCLPCEVIDPNDNKVITKKDKVLNVWQNVFSKLLNTEQEDKCISNNGITVVEQRVPSDPTGLNILDSEISINEINIAIQASNKGKASGVDGIHVEFLATERVVNFLHKLFNLCFLKGIFPSMWKKGVICPVPKSNISDSRDPNCYRGITLAVSTYKVFCSVLNARLNDWADQNGIIVEEQNGFRKNRSCIDHISSLVNIVETRIKRRQGTFAAFIDFRKAYDSVNRGKLWGKLCQLGLPYETKMHAALRGIYENVKCNVRIHGCNTDWFDVTVGLRQGCILSPILFNMYINDLVINLKQLCSGIPVGGENVVSLMYADDIVLLARNERDLQRMLDVLGQWCMKWNINVNPAKSEIIHFRNKSVKETSYTFKSGDINLNVVNGYRYLGLYLNEFLDFKVTADHVAKAANRALGVIIAKSKAFGGMPFSCFQKLYDAIVLPVINYGAAIWGHSQYSSINAVHNKACRFYLGVGRYTPSAAVQGDIGWLPPFVHQWIAITRNWCRFKNMADHRINKKILKWAMQYAVNGNCKNSIWKTLHYFKEKRLQDFLDPEQRVDKKDAVNQITLTTMDEISNEWKESVTSNKGKTKVGGNKLRTYCLLKSEFKTEPYVKCILGKKQRSAIGRFRCGTAPIRIETGRYEGILVQDRFCPYCLDEVEDEYHVLCECPLYDDLRNQFLDVLFSYMNCDFGLLSREEKLCLILSSENNYVIRSSANFCCNILERRKFFNVF
jgi:hypothetical protein